jgi:hypothetical protein
MQTMRTCANCGAALDESEADLAYCPMCGVDLQLDEKAAPPNGQPLIVGDDAVEQVGPTVPIEAQLTPQERVAIARADPADFEFDWPKDIPPPRSSFVGLAVGIGLAVLIVLLCTVAAFTSVNFTFPSLAQAQSPQIATVRPSGATPTSSIFSFPTQVAEPTPLPFTGQVPTDAPTQTPYGGVPTATPGGQASLSASPTTCSAGHRYAVFTLMASNLGSSVLTWQFAGANPPTYSTRPQNGTLTAASPNETVLVLNLGGTTITNATIAISYNVSGSAGDQISVPVGCP